MGDQMRHRQHPVRNPLEEVGGHDVGGGAGRVGVGEDQVVVVDGV